MAVIDAYTKLMLHMNGADTSTTFTDVMGKTGTAVGNAQIDTAASKFGGASGLFDGTGDYVSFADSDDFTFGSGDFTVDFWVRRAEVGINHYLIAQCDAAGADRSWEIALDASSNTVLARFWYDASNFVTAQTTGVTVTNDGAFHHIALVRYGNTLTLYLDGTAGATTGNCTGRTNTNSAAILAVGQLGLNGYGLKGWLDEVRISKGIARWTANFTPPTEEYTLSGYTNLALLGVG